MESLTARLHLEDRVEITGWADEATVREEILRSQVMVLPSFTEGLPVVIMEALALGRPVISTYIAGIPELVIPGECGWLVPAGSVSALVDAMREALQTPVDRLEAMGAAGAARVCERHNITVEATKLKELFENAISRSQPCRKK
jgi:glycosyltransferase involved in cell wall biosynthesis